MPRARTGCSVSEAAVLEVVHETHYRYGAPATQALHLAHLEPLQDARQTLLAHELTVQPEPAQRLADQDGWGNRRLFFALVQPHTTLGVRACSRVRVAPAAAGPWPGLPWEAVRDALRYTAGAPFDPAVEFVQPSPYVPRLAELRAYALPSFPAGRPVGEGAVDLMHRIHGDFRYEAASTRVDTPLAEAFARRRGVCQDFAHLMIGALRLLGLAARYVSGYLLTAPPAGEPALVGADASHAWVQVYVPDAEGVPGGWLELDPTNALRPDTRHVRLAVGRDYGDVTPLRGVIRGGGRHALEVRVDTRQVEPARMLLE
jgi:transglutaminase-like putative cysteine protease